MKITKRKVQASKKMEYFLSRMNQLYGFIKNQKKEQKSYGREEKRLRRLESKFDMYKRIYYSC